MAVAWMPKQRAAPLTHFFRTRRGSGGCGLGLHVVHNLLTQLLAGEITLRTAPLRGAAVILRIPLQTPEQLES